MASRLFILCGASGCGKTTLMSSVAKPLPKFIDRRFHPLLPQLQFNHGFQCIRAPKYAEREIREKRGEIDDVLHLKPITLDAVDLAYIINSKKYGIRFAPIEEILQNDQNVFLVVSDLRAIKTLKEHFGDQAVAIYVSSAIDEHKLRRIQLERKNKSPDAEQKVILSRHFSKISSAARLGWWELVSACVFNLERDWQSYATDEKSTEIRIARIRATHIRYVEHIQMFDHVVLNYTEGHPDDMEVQMLALLQSYGVAGGHLHTKRQRRNIAPIFVVTAASGAGKGTLMETLNLIGGDRIRIVSKLAKRIPNPKDRRDGMIAIKDTSADHVRESVPQWWTESMIDVACRGDFPMEYDIPWKFPEREKSRALVGAQYKEPIEYAVSSSEIQKNIDLGTPQIFVSNMSQVNTLTARWPKNVVVLYLHRLVSDKENRKYQVDKWESDLIEAEARIKERELVHSAYMKRIADFDHVLLNTSYEEDLYDQMFHLIAHHISDI